VNEKFVITVDTTSYIRTPIDYNDDWTAPDFRAEYSAEHGSAHAKAFDQAHLIQLIKAGQWQAPASLAASGAFYNGIWKSLATEYGTSWGGSVEQKAEALVQAHKDVIAEFIKRDLGGALNEFATLVSPDTFNLLLEHNKLMNVEFQGSDAMNNYAQRRIAWVNGLRIIETPRFPTAAITGHFLGTAYDINANEATARMIIFHPRKTLVTVEAQGMTVRVWDDKENFANVLDSYTMYNVGVKRGDAVAVIAEAAPTTTP
jgi:hypothetical protein